MSATRPRRICLVPRLAGVGGMVTFREKMEAGLLVRGIEVGHDPEDGACDAVLIIGGTRRLGELWRARRRGARLVQRLDGMNWLHRRRWTGLRHFLRAEYGNWLLAFTRARLSDHVIYQSHFARQWWERRRGPTRSPHAVVYNGVDLERFSPAGRPELPEGQVRLLLVEGSLMGGYELGLRHAVELAIGLAERLQVLPGRRRAVELTVAGRVEPHLRARWEHRLSEESQGERLRLVWAGCVPQARVAELDRAAHLLFAADLNPACPNSAIEALACGTPVVAFETGALPEIVGEEAGRLVPYGGDPWRLDEPDLPALAEAACEVVGDLERFRRGARARAEERFGLERMVEGYLQVLLE